MHRSSIASFTVAMLAAGAVSAQEAFVQGASGERHHLCHHDGLGERYGSRVAWSFGHRQASEPSGPTTRLVQQGRIHAGPVGNSAPFVSPITTSVGAISLGAIAFVLPMLFVHNPVLLLQSAATLALVAAIPGTVTLAAGLVGWFGQSLSVVGRVILLTAGTLLLVTNVWCAFAGLAFVALFLLVGPGLKFRIFYAS